MATTLPRSAEIVIVGGGIIGLSIAFHLTERGISRVVVLDRLDFLGCGSSGRSAGGFRQQFSSRKKIELARESLKFFREFDERFGTPLTFQQSGYLVLAQNEGERESLAKDCLMQREIQLPVDHLDSGMIEKSFPYLRCDDLAGANFCHTDGFLDPHALLQALFNSCKKSGVVILFGKQVTGIRPFLSGRGFEVDCGTESLSCGHVVNAAGAWAGGIAEMVGDRLPLRPSRRQIFVSAPDDRLGTTPLIIQSRDPFYFRREGRVFLLSIAERETIPEELYGDPPMDWSGAEILAERAAWRVPEFHSLRLARGWAGMRTETPDLAPILGESSRAPSFFHACGLSGHGITFSPAVGRLMADLIIGRPDTVQELAAFSPTRFENQLSVR